LRLSPSDWPSQADIPPSPSSDEQKEITLHVNLQVREPIFPIDRFSSYNMIVCVTSWVMRFVGNLKKVLSQIPPLKSPPTVQESVDAETYWISVSQSQCFSSKLKCLNSKVSLPSNSALFSLYPFIDSRGTLRVSGREQESKLAYCMHDAPCHFERQTPTDNVADPN
jgi:hypothetical protein